MGLKPGLQSEKAVSDGLGYGMAGSKAIKM
jgi:hypothetical protein